VGEDRRSAGEMSRYTVEEAAAVLGMTTEAVRNRLSKGILRSVEEHGTVYVLLPTYFTYPHYYTSRDAPHDTGDMPGMSGRAPMSEMRERIALLERELEESGALVSEMRERIALLERALEGSKALGSEMRERIAFLEREIAGKDAILTKIAETVKDILSQRAQEEPSEPPEAPRRWWEFWR
jgi:uncharacterized small protein (DUF1192 family)